MTLDLFPSQQGESIAAQAEIFTTEAGAIPRAILALEATYRGELALRAEVVRKLDMLTEQMNSAGYDRFGEVTFGDVENSSESLLAYVDRVEQFAAHELSMEGSPFTGSLRGAAYLDAADSMWRRYRSARLSAQEKNELFSQLTEHCSPVALWRVINQQFNPAAQRRAASAQAANLIRSELELKDRGGAKREMKIVKGRVEVVLSVCCVLRHGGGRQLSHRSRLPELGRALHQAMVDQGVSATFGNALTNLAGSLIEFRERHVISRERVDLGDGVDVVMGYDAFKLYMPQGIVNALNMFLAEYPET